MWAQRNETCHRAEAWHTERKTRLEKLPRQEDKLSIIKAALTLGSLTPLKRSWLQRLLYQLLFLYFPFLTPVSCFLTSIFMTGTGISGKVFRFRKLPGQIPENIQAFIIAISTVIRSAPLGLLLASEGFPGAIRFFYLPQPLQLLVLFQKFTPWFSGHFPVSCQQCTTLSFTPINFCCNPSCICDALPLSLLNSSPVLESATSVDRKL